MRRALTAWLSWRRIAVAGLAALTALLLLGTSLPDPSALGPEDLADLRAERPVALAIAERVPLGRILGSPWLLAAPSALAVAILWNLGSRLRQRSAARRVRRDRGPEAALRFEAKLGWDAPRSAEDVLRTVSTSLRHRLYAVERVPGGVVARRGALGFWGSICFHLGLVVVLVAIGLTLATSWRGEVLLAEGQDAALDDASAVHVLQRGPFAPEVPHAVVTLTRFTPRWSGEFPLDYRAELIALQSDGKLERATVRVNQPFAVDGQRLYLTRYGMAPFFEVKEQGRTLVSAPVSLTVIGGREDSFDVPGTGARVAARYLGEPIRRGRRFLSRSDIPKDPAFELRLVGDGSNGEPVLVHRGEEADLGPLRVAFPELRYWVVLGVDHDPGAGVLFLALIGVAAGLLLRFWDHDREIRIRVEPAGDSATRVLIGGRSRYFPALMERELEALRVTFGSPAWAAEPGR